MPCRPAGAQRRNREGPSFAVLSNPEFLADGTAIDADSHIGGTLLQAGPSFSGSRPG
jgi:UDP-glucose 6-dehydrogenase